MYLSPRSTPCRRATVLPLIAACGSGCHEWRTVPRVPAPITENLRASPLRITRKDGSQVIVDQPAMRGDTLLGRIRRDQPSADGGRVRTHDGHSHRRRVLTGPRLLDAVLDPGSVSPLRGDQRPREHLRVRRDRTASIVRRRVLRGSRDGSLNDPSDHPAQARLGVRGTKGLT